MTPQRIPGVKDAKRPPITARTYAAFVAIALAVFVVAMLVVASLDPAEQGGPTASFELAGPASTSCVYDAAAQEMTIKTHLEANAPGGADVVLTAGVRNRDTDRIVSTVDRAVYVNGQVADSYTFVVEVPTAVHADGATSCFVEVGVNS
jgi:hypothetical protein